MKPAIIQLSKLATGNASSKEKTPTHRSSLLQTSPAMCALLLLWSVFDVLSLGWLKTPAPLLDVVGFLALLIVPGSLVGVASGWLRTFKFTELAYSIGVGLLLLMVIPLLGNFTLPLFGISHPLDKPWLLLDFNVFVVAAAVAAWRRGRTLATPRPLTGLGWRDYLVLSVGVFLVMLSIFGAFSLNNGSTSALTFGMLDVSIVTIISLISWSDKLKESTLISVLYSLGLSLLLATSLRGWHTTGHDINLETRVFELTKNAGVWKYSNFKDPYNACLSLTILPTVFANLLKQADVDVFKTYFQLIFALTPPLIYANMRRFMKQIPAILSAVYFLAYPTFFTDMPYINRQEIAFVFIGLMYLALLDTKRNLKFRRLLFVLLGLGMILSHYSTTYATIAILILAYSLRPGLTFIVGLFRHLRTKFKLPPIVDKVQQEHLITIPMLAVLIVVSLVWTTVLTNTSSGLSSTVGATFSAMKNGFSDNSRSDDANNLLYGQLNLSQSQLNQYIGQQITPLRTASPEAFYTASTYSKLSTTAKNEYTSPLTKLGTYLKSRKINVSSVIDGISATSPKLIALFAFAGIGCVLVRRKQFEHLPPELITLAIASLVFVIMQVVLPEISIQYGLPRAYQQALFALSLFLVIGSVFVFSKVPGKALRLGLPVIVVVIYYMMNTGLINALVGGYDPNIDVSNSGTYYNVYYPHRTDLAAENWLSSRLHDSGEKQNAKPVVQAEEYSILNMQATNTSLNMTEGLYPGMILKNSYVFLNYTNVTKQQSTILYDGNLITYKLPLQFFNSNKNLIYSNGDARIYR